MLTHRYISHSSTRLAIRIFLFLSMPKNIPLTLFVACNLYEEHQMPGAVNGTTLKAEARVPVTRVSTSTDGSSTRPRTARTPWVGASYCTNWYRAAGTSTVLVRYRYN